MKWSLERKLIAGGFSLALFLTGLSSFFSHQNATQLIESAAKVQHTHTVLKNLTNLFALLVDAEAGRRGYILSGDPKELERYYQAIHTLDPKLSQLQQWTANDPDQKQKLASLQLLIAQRASLAQQSIVLYQQDPEARAEQTRLLAQSQRIRLEIRQVIAQMQTNEQQRLQRWVGQSQSSIRYRQWIELLSTFLSFAILFGSFALLFQQLVKRQEAEVQQRILAQEKELSELKLRFFSLVSHEFRTPLSIILGSSQLLANSSQQWEEQKRLKNLQRIQSSARLMIHLLTDILTFSRAEAGKLEFNPDWVELESFCLNLIADFELFNGSEHPIQFVSQGRYPHAKLDEKLLHSILSNLLSNAIKYSPTGKPIYFRLSCEPEAVIFQIQDEGIGIPQESLSALYEPFYRADNVGTIVGTGLGLAVVKKCLEVHQGEISVESKVGVGTTFTVRIPQGEIIKLAYN
jgi:signal transduction histidine kinase